MRDIPAVAFAACALEITLGIALYARGVYVGKLIKQTKELTERQPPPANLAA